MKILSVVSEVYPLVKTGGLADVAGALPAAMAPLGVEMVSLVPGYPAVMRALESGATVADLGVMLGGPARIVSGRAAGLDLLVLDAPALFERSGNPYLAPGGTDWPDNPLRFAALAQVAARVGRGLIDGFVPDVVHGHDWQAALVCAYLKLDGGPPSVLTIHNLAFQGLAPADLLETIGLPSSAFTVDGVEYYGNISYLKAGLVYADRITTVSPSYAAEIQTDAGGMGLGGVLRSRAADLVGIVNGLDLAVWDPGADTLLASRFGGEDLAGREANRGALREAFGLVARPEALLFGVVGRLTDQKGMDLLTAVLPVLLGFGGQLAVLGSGDRGIEAALQREAAAHPGEIGVRLAFDEGLAHRLQAGCDALIVPSRFEPCGLTQLSALRYGAVPVVSRVGGLADTVIDANEAALAAGVATGFQFAPPDAEALAGALRRVGVVWGDKAAWAGMQRAAMRADVGWTRPARRYVSVYEAARNG